MTEIDISDSIDLPLHCSCGQELDAGDYEGMRHNPNRDITTGKDHLFSCSRCGVDRYVCPVCEDDGMFDTHDSGRLTCHNCQPQAARSEDRQRRRQPRTVGGR